MYHIAICDDDPAFVPELQTTVESLLRELDAPVRLSAFGSTEALDRALHSARASFHLLLLGCLSPAEDAGMRLAQKLRGEGNHISIILISASPDFALRGYDVQALGYLLKPLDQDRLRKAVLYDYLHNFEPRHLTLQKGAAIDCFVLSEILYLETVGRTTTIHLTGSTQDCAERLCVLELLLPRTHFCRCHQSFILNLDNTRHICRYQAALKNGGAIPISKAYYRDVQESFLRRTELRGLSAPAGDR